VCGSVHGSVRAVRVLLRAVVCLAVYGSAPTRVCVAVRQWVAVRDAVCGRVRAAVCSSVWRCVAVCGSALVSI
jgi:hypothetical protein